MSVSQVEKLVEELGNNLDDLESALAPLLEQAFATSTLHLPLLDKAKIYVLATYAIESLLFSYLRLNGVDAKEHAVFKELTRVKAYFEKIKLAESGPEKRPTALDKDAAARFIKHGLAGNDRYDKQRTAAKRSAEEMNSTSQWGSANRFEGMAKRMRAQEESVTVVKASDVDDVAISKDNSVDEQSRAERKAARKQRRQQAALAKQSPISDQHDEEDSIVQNASSISTPAQPEDATTVLAQPDAADTISRKMHKKKKRKSRGDVRRELEDKRANEMA